MKVLAIETSCDETGVSVLKCSGDLDSLSFDVLGNELLSQILAHREYGGVYPNLAKRLHGENLIPILREALKEAGMLVESSVTDRPSEAIYSLEIVFEREPVLLKKFIEFVPNIEKPPIDVITVTQGPGLEPALWVGLNFAKALSLVWDIPMLPVNHMEGHIASVLYKDKEQVDFPALVLLVSGGHTELVLAKNWGEYEILGATRDDAVGEAFDKVGRMLELPYPGGPEISKLAEESRGRAPKIDVNLPRPMIDSKDYDFSFSGLKTAVLYLVRDKSLSMEEKEDIARAFEDSVVDVLISKTSKALKQYDVKTLIVSGGVVANLELQKRLKQIKSVKLRIPHSDITGDNATMIGIAGYIQYLKNKEPQTSIDDVVAKGNLSLKSTE